jgi:hypothetical protein
VDLDDTLIVRERVNLCLIRFLYQAVNAGKRIHLLTRHEGDVSLVLREHKIAAELFDSVMQLMAGEPKSGYIVANDAVFIDDSFAERREVAHKLGIPVFDTDMVESLLEYK